MASCLLICAAATCLFASTPTTITAPQGAALNRIQCPANGTLSVPNKSVIPDDGRELWFPPAPVQTTISVENFINRFSSAAQQAIQTAAQTNWQIANWQMKLAAAGTIDVTDPQVVTGINGLVAAGLLTQAQATQILDLSVASP